MIYTFPIKLKYILRAFSYNHQRQKVINIKNYKDITIFKILNEEKFLKMLFKFQSDLKKINELYLAKIIDIARNSNFISFQRQLNMYGFKKIISHEYNGYYVNAFHKFNINSSDDEILSIRRNDKNNQYECPLKVRACSKLEEERSKRKISFEVKSVRKSKRIRGNFKDESLAREKVCEYQNEHKCDLNDFEKFNYVDGDYKMSKLGGNNFKEYLKDYEFSKVIKKEKNLDDELNKYLDWKFSDIKFSHIYPDNDNPWTFRLVDDREKFTDEDLHIFT